MPHLKVHIPDYVLGQRRRMSAAQWLQEFGLSQGGRTRVHRFPQPVRLGTCVAEGEQVTENFRSAGALFRRLFVVAAAGGVVITLSWSGAHLGRLGLHRLNVALHQPAHRRGGKSVVQSWLEHRRGGSTPLACDLPSLLAYLEIRPLPTKKSLTTKPTPIPR